MVDSTDLLQQYTPAVVVQEWTDQAHQRLITRSSIAGISVVTLLAGAVSLTFHDVQANLWNLLWAWPSWVFLVGAIAVLIGGCGVCVAAGIDVISHGKLLRWGETFGERKEEEFTARQALRKPPVFRVGITVADNICLSIHAGDSNQCLRQQTFERDDEAAAQEKLVEWQEEIEAANIKLYEQSLQALSNDGKRALQKSRRFKHLPAEVVVTQIEARTDVEAAADIEERLRSTVPSSLIK